jgi:hypothetical protein
MVKDALASCADTRLDTTRQGMPKARHTAAIQKHRNNSSVALSDEYSARVSENKVLRRIFWSKGEIVKERRKLHDNIRNCISIGLLLGYAIAYYYETSINPVEISPGNVGGGTEDTRGTNRPVPLSLLTWPTVVVELFYHQIQHKKIHLWRHLALIIRP